MKKATTIIFAAVLLAGCATTEVKRSEVPQQFPLTYFDKEQASFMSEEIVPAETVSQLEETCSWEGNYCITTPTSQYELKLAPEDYKLTAESYNYYEKYYGEEQAKYQESLEPESKSFLGGVLEVLGKIFSGGFGGFGGSPVFSGPILSGLNFGGFMSGISIR